MMSLKRAISEIAIFAIALEVFIDFSHAQTVTTPAALPTITDANFIGYRSNGSTWFATSCPPSSLWAQSSTWGRCCAPDPSAAPCGIWTSCREQSIVIESGGRLGICSGLNPVCRTATILTDEKDTSPVLYVGCGTANWTAFRTPPAAIMQTITDSVISVSQTVSSMSSSPTPNSTKATTTTSSNKVWIAGAVIGPAAVAIIVGLLVYIRRLRKAKTETKSLPSVEGRHPSYVQGYAYDAHGNVYPVFHPSGDYFAGGAKMPACAEQSVVGTPNEPAELVATQTPVEMSADSTKTRSQSTGKIERWYGRRQSAKATRGSL